MVEPPTPLITALVLEYLTPLFLGFSPTTPIALPRFVLDVAAPHPSHAPPAFHRVPFWDHYSSLPTSLPSQALLTFIHNVDRQQYAITPMTPNCLFLYLHPTFSTFTCPISITSLAVLTPCMFGSSPNHYLLFAAHAHTIAACSAVIHSCRPNAMSSIINLSQLPTWKSVF